MGMGMGRGMWLNLNPQQVAQVFDLRHKFMNDTANLRKEIWVKRAELAQLWKADKPDEKAIVAKQKELNNLRGQMMEKAVAFRLKLKEIAPQLGEFGPGKGMGPGRGIGPGLGRGAGAGPGSGPGYGSGPRAEGPDDLDYVWEESLALGPPVGW
jgi:zinc resistance-associated protein